MTTWYWINTGRACGGIAVNDDGIVIDSAPYFRFLKGKKLCDIDGKVIKLENHPGRDTYD